MKIVAYVGAVLVSLAVMSAGAIALALTSHGSRVSLLIFLGVVPLTVMVYGPLLLGSLLAFWDVTRSDKARVFYRRWVTGIVIAQGVGAIAIVVDATLGGTTWWVAIAFIVAGIVLTMLALVIGNAVRRHEARRAPETVELWQPIEPEAVRRKVRTVVLTFIITLVLSIVVFVILELSLAHPSGWPRSAAVALDFPLLAAALACIIVALPLGRRLRETADGDLGRMRTFARVVLKGKNEDLSPDEELGAARYASGISLFLRFQLGYLVLLYGGLFLQQVSSLLGGGLGAFPLVLLGVFILILVVLLPLQLRRIQRARRYAEAHRELLGV